MTFIQALKLLNQPKHKDRTMVLYKDGKPATPSRGFSLTYGKAIATWPHTLDKALRAQDILTGEFHIKGDELHPDYNK